MGKNFHVYGNNIELNHFSISVIISCCCPAFPFQLSRGPKGPAVWW